MSVLFSCSKEKEEIMDDTIYYSGSVAINDTVSSEIGQAIIIEAGAEITFGPEGILIANGDLEVRGTADNMVKLTGSQELVLSVLTVLLLSLALTALIENAIHSCKLTKPRFRRKQPLF